MINAYMSRKEILHEFWETYEDQIKPRCFRIAERHKKNLIPLQKKKPGKWLKMKETQTVKWKGNIFNILLWVMYQDAGKIAIKTTCWCSYFSKSGSRRILLLPARETVDAVIVFSVGFMREWKDQLLNGGEGRADTEVEAEFFKWVEGNYVVYHSESDNSKIEVDLNNLGAGIGRFSDGGRYKFEHFLSETLIGKMQDKVGHDIKDPIKLWEMYNEKPKKEIQYEDPTYDYYQEEKLKTLDEIFEKYG